MENLNLRWAALKMTASFHSRFALTGCLKLIFHRPCCKLMNWWYDVLFGRKYVDARLIMVSGGCKFSLWSRVEFSEVAWRMEDYTEDRSVVKDSNVPWEVRSYAHAHATKAKVSEALSCFHFTPFWRRILLLFGIGNVFPRVICALPLSSLISMKAHVDSSTSVALVHNCRRTEVMLSLAGGYGPNSPLRPRQWKWHSWTV